MKTTNFEKTLMIGGAALLIGGIVLAIMTNQGGL